MDFAGPLLPSIFHRFTCYACVVDAGSGYGRLYPAHHMTAAVATAALDAFTVEMGAHMGFHGTFKPPDLLAPPPVSPADTTTAGESAALIRADDERLESAMEAHVCAHLGRRMECCFFPKVVLFFPIRIHVHSYACVCIHMHFIVFCMHTDALHSTNRLHSNAFCNHFELLHSSDASRLHSDAFSYLLHSRHVTFACIFKHPEGPLHVDAFAT